MSLAFTVYRSGALAGTAGKQLKIQHYFVFFFHKAALGHVQVFQSTYTQGPCVQLAPIGTADDAYADY